MPWLQSICGDFREDQGIDDQVPQPDMDMMTTNASCSNPGTVYSGDTDADFGNGQASETNQVVGGDLYPETISQQTLAQLQTSYSALVAKYDAAGITPTNLQTVCQNLANCTLPANLAHGIYLANGNVTLNAYNFPNAQNYIFLIDGNLTVDGNITVPVGSTALFSAKNNITVSAAVGSQVAVTTSDLDGWYIAGQSFIVQTAGNCQDLRLNTAGVVVVNALGNGGTLENNRNLCGWNPVYPSLTFSQRLDFILNAPSFLEQTQIISHEVAP